MKRFNIITAIYAALLIQLLIIPFAPGSRVPVLIVVSFVYGLLVIYGASRIDSQFFIPAICKGGLGSAKIALTFDDGPDKQRSRDILTLLDKYNSPATFFLTGKNAGDLPGIVESIIQKGHLVGNHSYSHSIFFPLFRPARIRREVELTNRVLESAGAGQTVYFRPPFGVSNPNVARGLKNSGMLVAGWSLRSFDTRNEAAPKVVERIMRRIGEGDVILLHETSVNILGILELLLPAISKVGLTCVTLDRLPGYSLSR